MKRSPDFIKRNYLFSQFGIISGLIIIFLITFLISTPIKGGELTGTWHGYLTQNNHTFEIEWTFSEDGYLMFPYTNNDGRTLAAELRYPGQKIEYVPSGGGVKRHIITAIKYKSKRFIIYHKNYI